MMDIQLEPIGRHEVEVLRIDDRTVWVWDLEAIDRTPVLDLTPAVGPAGAR